MFVVDCIIRNWFLTFVCNCIATLCMSALTNIHLAGFCSARFKSRRQIHSAAPTIKRNTLTYKQFTLANLLFFFEKKKEKKKRNHTQTKQSKQKGKFTWNNTCNNFSCGTSGARFKRRIVAQHHFFDDFFRLCRKRIDAIFGKKSSVNSMSSHFFCQFGREHVAITDCFDAHTIKLFETGIKNSKDFCGFDFFFFKKKK